MDVLLDSVQYGSKSCEHDDFITAAATSSSRCFWQHGTEFSESPVYYGTSPEYYPESPEFSTKTAESAVMCSDFSP